MLVIKNGIVYNTDKLDECTLVGTHRTSNSDWSDSLYKGKNGYYFIIQSKNVLTEMDKDRITYNEEIVRIIPQDVRTAIIWCENHLCGADWVKYFDIELKEA